MKKYLSLALALCFVAVVGCSSQQEEATVQPSTTTITETSTQSETESTTQDVAPVVSLAQDEPLVLDDMTQQYTYDASDAQDLGITEVELGGIVDMVISYPVIAGEGVVDLNHQFLDFATQFHDFGVSCMSAYDYTGELSYNVSRNDGRWLSVQFTYYAYIEGGAHPSTNIQGMNYDLTKGITPIALDDIFVGGDYWDRIVAEILACEDFAVYEDFLFQDDLTDTQWMANFYLTEDSLVIYYQAYDIGPYALGMPSFAIPFENISDILIPDLF